MNVNPHVDRDRVHREAERCVRQLGFVGIVLDTFGYAVNPNGQDAQTIFEIGRELAVPVVVHTGTGVPFGLPSAVLPRAREYSDVKIVLAHAGAGLYTVEADVVAREAANVYLETSWCRDVDVKQLINDLGANRVMFGADIPASVGAELAKIRALNLYQFQQHLVFGQAAIDVFALQGVPEIPEPAAVA
jgi:predicted TIM-barrel fold metal-dependent hydrolase